MPKVTHISSGVTASVSAATAEALDASAWRLAEAPQPATKPATKKAPARKRKAAEVKTDD